MNYDRDVPLPQRLQLDDQLCFALYAATHMVTRAYRPLLQDIGLTYPQYLVMLVLWQDGGSLVGHIADRLKLSSNAITPLLDRLEGNGLVQRFRDKGDRRVVSVELTRAGVELERAASLAQQNVVCQTALSPQALGALRDELKQLVRQMEEVPDSCVAQEQRAARTPA